MKRSLVAPVCDFRTWQFFHLPASATPPASFWADFLCAAKSRMTGDWLLDGALTWFNLLQTTWTNFGVSKNCNVCTLLKQSPKFRLAGFETWLDLGVSYRKSKHDSAPMHWLRWVAGKATTFGELCHLLWQERVLQLTRIIRWDTWKPRVYLYRFTISTVAHQISLQPFSGLHLESQLVTSCLWALHRIYYFHTFRKFRNMKIAAC